MRRNGRPGLLGLAARTAVVAGTANAVSGSMQRGQAQQAQAQANAQQLAAHQQQAQINAAAQAAAAQFAAPAPAVAPAPTPVAAPAFDLVDEIAKLAAHRDAGVLNEAEFSAAKAKLLS